MMNILMVDCLAIGKKRRRFTRDFIGGGPRLIAGMLYSLDIKDLNVEIIRAEKIFSKEFKTKDLKKYKIFLVSAMTMDLLAVKNIVEIMQKANKKAPIIIGGPICSDKTILEAIKADITVSGEGEKKITMIFNILLNSNLKLDETCFKRLSEVNGITFRKDEEIFITNDAPKLLKKEFDSFTPPEMTIDLIKQYPNFKFAKIYVECLRGCSNYLRTKLPLTGSEKCLETCTNCSSNPLNPLIMCPSQIPPGCGFCATIDSFGPPKSRNIPDIVSEIKKIIDIGARRIVLGGPDFLDYKREDLTKNFLLTTPGIPPEPNYKALEQLINQILSIKAIENEEVQIFIENIKASLCTKKALKILSKIPNSIFSIGCETGSPEFSSLLGRPFSPDKTILAVRDAIKLGIRVHVYFIHSLPGEKIFYIKKSIDLINKFFELGVDKITIYKYQEFPGAPFYSLKNKARLLQRKNNELNIYRKKLVSLAIHFNKLRKEEMIGSRQRVLIAEPDFSNKSNAIGYMIKGGPKVLVHRAFKILGGEAIVMIKKVISDKLIEGDIIKKLAKKI